jgi:two-component system NtrC family sensor kinase
VKHKLEMQNIRAAREAGCPDNLPAGGVRRQPDPAGAILVLLVNASEAMPKGGVLEISAAFDPATEQIAVRVKDSGSGIPEEVLPHIFDPFFTTKEDQNRTGLGLAVARSIVEQHAGEISVRSTAREGTEFTVALPVAAAVASVGGNSDRGNT